MSFSSLVKEELTEQLDSGRHCQIACLLALYYFGAETTIINDQISISFRFENEAVSLSAKRLFKRLFGYHADVIVKEKKSGQNIYVIEILENDTCNQIIEVLKLVPYFESFLSLPEKTVVKRESIPWNGMILQKSCCKRAFIRGAFLMAGSVNDPNKAYHYEIVLNHLENAKTLQSLFKEFGLEAKIVQRKKYQVVYLKEGAMIVDALNIMGAHKRLMDMENVRILKDVRNSINRRVNCETANLNKTVSAAVVQIEDIEYVIAMKGINFLSPALREIATLRLEEPDASLAELGNMITPPVSRSGVNHRLKKISSIAQELREKQI